MLKLRIASTALAAVVLAAGSADAAGLSKGTPDWKSAGPISFGPKGVLFLADSQGAAIFAVDTADVQADSAGGPLKVDGIDEKVAALLGTTSKGIVITDLAVNPASGKAYLTVARGKGPDAAPVLVRVDRSGKLEIVSLENVPFAKASLPNPPTKEKAKAESITDLAFVDGRVFIAGLSNEEFASRLLSIPYPFADASKGTSVEIYHGAHGRFETGSPVRTFAPYQIKGESFLLAAYTCTPLVKLPVAQLKPGTHVKGTTIAELGNHNKPLDLIVYHKDGKAFLLLTNSSRGVMKIPTEKVETQEGITKQVKDTDGIAYEKIEDLKGVTQLDELDKDHALILVQTPAGAQNLETIALP
ncbi:hypothetical protein SAMN05444166_1351 [Singulisphaera sp. GP187]|uniref:hypothetical protein n=1 Tax=Singulisphaera sp. GP187 TaxID=1882752 RepID=UPI0009275E11|nr:hypothetical protein [Singulisphaera sp. GP187]SIN86766.1 hypothetical protein SAMN05444166_1351 [Singulisphaera sp. GP187]